jgi:SAM-dependent methyltransferase
MAKVVQPFEYVGTELETFALARNWKRYAAVLLRPYVRGDVLEVGAGIGAVAQTLAGPWVSAWTALEPDLRLASILAKTVVNAAGRVSPRIVVGTIDAVPAEAQFDAVLYFDVLEHIKDDRGELLAASSRVRPGGNLVVLAPAFPFVYSPFDKAVGHYRRYTKASLAAAMPSSFEPALLVYVDSIGLLLSAVNRALLRQPRPKRSQIVFWDRVIVPLSRIVDPLLRGLVGRSVIGVYRRPPASITGTTME